MTTTYSSYDTTRAAATMNSRGPGGRILVALGLLLLAGAVASGGWTLVTRVFGGSTLDLSASAPAAGATAVSVNSDNADLRITWLSPESADTVAVHATGRYGRGEPQVTARNVNGTVLVDVQCSDGWFNWCDVNATVSLPAGLNLTVTDDNGDVSVGGTGVPATGNVRIFTDNGDVDVSGGTGTLNLTTDNGDIDVQNSSSRSVTLATDNGDVTLRSLVDPDVVQASSNNGDITITVPGAVKYQVNVSTDNGDAKSDVGVDSGSPFRITATSDNGDVRVRPVG